MKTLAFVRIQDWQFQKPVFVGDTIHVVTEVETITPRGRRSGEVVWFRKVVNQRGEVVQTGQLITLVSAKDFLPRSKAKVSPATQSKLEKFRKVGAEG